MPQNNGLKRDSYDITSIVKKIRSYNDTKLERKNANKRIREDDDLCIVSDSHPQLSLIEDAVTEHLSKFKGIRCDDIESILKQFINHRSKSYFSYISSMMLGGNGTKVPEFDDVGITMRSLRLDGGSIKESISFPYFDYNRLIDDSWDNCEIKGQFASRFLFMIYDVTDAEDDPGDATFKDLIFWSMPEKDIEEVKKVWVRTREQIMGGYYESFTKKTENPVTHIRQHGANSEDKCIGPDGNMHKKNCFWINNDYITNVVLNELKSRENNDGNNRWYR